LAGDAGPETADFQGTATVNVLLCVDRSEASRKVVRVVADLLKGRGTGDKVTLYHVAEFLPEFLLSDHPEPGMTSRGLAERWAGRAKADGERLLAERKQELIAAGVPAAAVHEKLELKDCLPESKKVAAALAIIGEMQAGNYDLVCIGRRGASELALSFIGGVTEKVIREAHGRSMLVVD
jgi:nucleotide-binding universal stress UspA family protein